MARLPDERPAAVTLDPRREQPRALHVVDDLGAGIAREHILGEQHELAIGEDDLAVLGHDAEPVAVAVESEAELGVAGFQRPDQLDQILGLRRIGMVVGEAPVHLAVELGHFAAQAPVEPRREHAGDAVAAVDREVHAPRELHVPGDALDIGVKHVRFAALARAGLEIAALDARAQRLDLIAVERFAGDHHLQAVVLGRVVAAAHGDAAAAAQVMRREVGNGRRRHADIDHVGARAGDAFGQRRDQLGARQPAVAAHREGRRVALASERAERPADVAHDRRRQAAADDAADVVGAKDLGGQLHARRNSISRRVSQPRAKPTCPPEGGSSSETQPAAPRVAASSARSGRNGSLRALMTSVGTRMRASHGPLDEDVQ